MDFFLFHGKFWLGKGRFADAMIVRRGRIQAVGQERELYLRAAGCDFISCGGRTVIPGLFDACLCLAAAGSPLPEGAVGLEEAVQTHLSAHPRLAKKGARLYWRSAGEELTRQQLDILWPHSPLVLEDVALARAWANGKALERLERKGIPPALAAHVAFGEDGRPIGRFSGPACPRIAGVIPSLGQRELKSRALMLLRQAARAGVTTVQSADLGLSLSEKDLPVVRQLYRERGDLPRLQFFSQKPRGLSPDFAGRLTAVADLTLALWQPGQLVAPVEDGPALDQVLEQLRRHPLPAENFRRMTLLGAPCTNSRQLRELGEQSLGVIGFPGRLEKTLAACAGQPGADLSTCCAFRTLKGLGAHMAFGGLDSLTPFSGLQKAVLREGKEALSLEAALETWTSGGAWTGFQEDALGKLQPGYQADLAVLDRDLFTLPPEALRHVRPVLTMAAGRVLHREI